jgi:glutamine cyclotransferase
MSAIWAGDERTKHGADVLNGISVSEDSDLLYITGKKWDRMFLVR